MTDDQSEWVPATDDPPRVRYRGEVWFVCPFGGFDCARVTCATFGEAWARDAVAIHVVIHHRHWR